MLKPRDERLMGNSVTEGPADHPDCTISLSVSRSAYWCAVTGDTQPPSGDPTLPPGQMEPESNFQVTENKEDERQIKWHNEGVVSQLEMWNILQDDWPSFFKKQMAFNMGGGTTADKRLGRRTSKCDMWTLLGPWLKLTNCQKIFLR